MKVIIVTKPLGYQDALHMAAPLRKYEMPHAIMTAGDQYVLIRKILPTDLMQERVEEINESAITYTCNWPELEAV